MLQIMQFRVKELILFGLVIILFLSLAVFLVLGVLVMHLGVVGKIFMYGD